MRHGFIVALATCLTGAGAALAEAPAAPLVALPAVSGAPAMPYVDAPVADAPFCPQYDDAACGPRVWGGAEYLLWWIKDAPVPTPLVTTGPTFGGAGGAGVLGGLGTTNLLGGDNVGFGPFSGGRLTLGAWLGDDQRFGVEANYLYLFQQSRSQSVSSSGLPGSTNFGIPIFNVVTGMQDSLPLANSSGPGLAPFSGTGTLSLTTRLQGGEANALFGLTDPSLPLQVHLLGGFRYLNLTENLAFDTSSAILGANITRSANDDFGANNNFYGGQLGVRAEYTWGRFELQATAKAALGVMQENVRINGSTTTNFGSANGAQQTFPGGFLAVNNIGSFTQNRFAVVPEGDLKLSYHVTDHIAVSAGYSFLYLSDVVRPGNQINNNINPAQLAPVFGSGAAPLTPAAPALRSSDFWAQGVNFGVEFKF